MALSINTNLLRTAISDLEYIRHNWKDITDDDIRRNVGVLYYLLVERQIEKLWNQFQFGYDLTLEAPTLEKYTSVVPMRKITFACAGGARPSHGEMSHAVMLSGLTPEESEMMSKAPASKGKEVDIVGFNKMVVMIVCGIPITREQLIKFVRHKLGGSGHYDDTRTTNELKVMQLALEQWELNDKNSVYLEILAAGQLLVRAPSVVKLIEQGTTYLKSL